MQNKSPLGIREHKTLILLREGYTPKEIAPMLHLSVSTVKFYCRIIYAMLGAKNACQAVVLALRKGWINLQDEERNGR